MSDYLTSPVSTFGVTMIFEPFTMPFSFSVPSCSSLWKINRKEPEWVKRTGNVEIAAEFYKMEINEGVKAGTSEWEPASERTHMGICELMHAPRADEKEKNTHNDNENENSFLLWIRVLSSWQTAVERLIRKPRKQQQKQSEKKKCTVMNFCLRSLARVCVLQNAKI